MAAALGKADGSAGPLLSNLKIRALCEVDVIRALPDGGYEIQYIQRHQKLVRLYALGLFMASCPIAASQTSTLIVSGEQNSLSADPTQQHKTAPLQSSGDNAADRIRVLPVTDPIKIDGRLDELAWSQAEAASDFRQQEPNEGSPATEKTEVPLLFDEKNIYIGIHAFRFSFRPS